MTKMAVVTLGAVERERERESIFFNKWKNSA